MQRKVVLLVLVLLLMSVRGAGAQSSASYVVQRTTLTSGGAAGSGSYRIWSVIGQPDTDTANSSSYHESAGFLFNLPRVIFMWMPSIHR